MFSEKFKYLSYGISDMFLYIPIWATRSITIQQSRRKRVEYYWKLIVANFYQFSFISSSLNFFNSTQMFPEKFGYLTCERVQKERTEYCKTVSFLPIPNFSTFIVTFQLFTFQLFNPTVS